MSTVAESDKKTVGVVFAVAEIKKEEHSTN